MQTDDAGKVSPGLAASFTASTDGLTYTFKLRPDAVFSDGLPLTSKDVAAMFDYELTDEANAQAGSTTFWKTITAPDPETVVMTLNSPQPSLPNIVAQPAQSLYPAEAFDDVTGFFAKPVSAGAYAIKNYASNGTKVELIRNKKFYGAKPGAANFVYTTIPDESSRIIALKAGTIDVALDLPPSAVDQLNTPTSEAQALKVYGNQWLWMNNRKGPLSD